MQVSVFKCHADKNKNILKSYRNLAIFIIGIYLVKNILTRSISIVSLLEDENKKKIYFWIFVKFARLCFHILAFDCLSFDPHSLAKKSCIIGLLFFRTDSRCPLSAFLDDSLPFCMPGKGFAIIRTIASLHRRLKNTAIRF